MSTNQSFASELQQTETSIFVNWSGGGQIKPVEEQWTLDSIFRAAAGFPNKVAKYPQRCWAILTRYPNNYSFLASSLNHIAVRNFANVQQYAVDLLDDFMGHKSNLRIIENVFDEPTEYVAGPGENPVDVRAQDLVRNRTKIKAEMAKIVKVIETLDEDPVGGLKNKPSDIEPPEIWATRLPVRRTIFEEDHPELAPISESIENALQSFNFVWADNEKERSELLKKMQNPPPTPKKPQKQIPAPPPIVTPKALAGMIKKDRDILDSLESRKKYGAFLFDQSSGMPDRSITFNDVLKIEEATLSQGWPTRLEIGLVELGDKEVLGYYELEYAGKSLVKFKNGSDKDLAKETNDRKSKLTLDLDSAQKVVAVTFVIGTNSDGSVFGIRSVEIDVKEGPKQKLRDRSKDDVIVECVAPEGFGLKGFYGHAESKRPIERIGVIWGK
ncbi:hypothetical protein RhiLY_01466 [Ceratobasidium sp. AG-Ba]|nr:hypothetical protein RhiLY_01466 [Ceratobasidium sp. AG-Ba]